MVLYTAHRFPMQAHKSATHASTHIALGSVTPCVIDIGLSPLRHEVIAQ